MRFLMIVIALLLVSACSFFTEDHDDNYGAGYINVSESEWGTQHNTAYPFTVPFGEISCGLDVGFGREVYFAPKGYTDEKYISIPLNQAALNSMKAANMVSDVPYAIKEKALLDTAIKIGLNVCDEQRESLKNNKTI